MQDADDFYSRVGSCRISLSVRVVRDHKMVQWPENAQWGQRGQTDPVRSEATVPDRTQRGKRPQAPRGQRRSDAS